MMKLKVILSFFLLLTFQVAYSSTNRQVEEIKLSGNAEAVSQLQFEENPYSPFISGEVPAGQGHSVVYPPDSQRYFSHFSSEDLHLAILQSLLSTTAVQGKTLRFGCSGYYLINIPIFLQTDNFRL